MEWSLGRAGDRPKALRSCPVSVRCFRTRPGSACALWVKIETDDVGDLFCSALCTSNNGSSALDATSK